MKHLLIAVPLLILPLAFGGCSKSDSGPAEAPPVVPGISEVEPNDAVPQALGALGSADLRVNGNCSNGSDVDWFSVALNDTANLHVSLDWTSGDLDLGVADPEGIMVVFRDTGAKPERCTLPLRPPGTYRVRVTSKIAAATAYTLVVGPR